MTAVEFGELPPDGRGRSGYDWDAVAKELKAHPSAWAKVHTCENKQKAGNSARQIRRGGPSFRPAGQFEATARGLDVWARYIGGAS